MVLRKCNLPDGIAYLWVPSSGQNRAKKKAAPAKRRLRYSRST
jgi:hypothetical protein